RSCSSGTPSSGICERWPASTARRSLWPRVGCSMGSVRARKDNGLLFFDFRYQGRRCREQTLLTDTPANRKRMEKVLARIEAEFEAGTFDYAATFPKSKHTSVAGTAQTTGSTPGPQQPLPAAI